MVKGDFMFTKKFSLDVAYSTGVRRVLDYFSFFILAIGLGGLACAAALVILGVVDFYTLGFQMAPLIKMLQHVSTNATGALHYGGTTIQEIMRPYLSAEIAQQSMGRDIISVDVANYDFRNLFIKLIPTMLILKLFVDTISIGWTKIALDLNVNKPVSLRYLFSFYYLTPRVFVVNLIVGIATIIGTALFVIPGIFVYQRLRFSKYFIIDKNLSIIKALQASWALTEQATLQLFGFTVISIVLETIGHILVLTYLFLIPLQNQVEANVYQQMLEAK